MSETMIGILSGMGPRATAPFVDAVVNQCQKIYGAVLDEEFPKMMILSLPTPFYIDRPIDHEKMKARIVEGLQHLESTGVDFISMPCNSAHIYYSDLSASINIPLLNIISATLSNLTESGKVTLLGTQITIDSGLYQKGFKQAELNFEFHKAWQKKTDRLIYLIKSGNIENEATKMWSSILEDMEDAQIQQAVLACTDINVVLPYVKTPITFVDSTESLAVATVKKYLEISG